MRSMKGYKMISILAVVVMFSTSALGTSVTVWYQHPEHSEPYKLYVNSTVAFSSANDSYMDNWMVLSVCVQSVTNNVGTGNNVVTIYVSAVGYSKVNEYYADTGGMTVHTLDKPYKIRLSASQSNVPSDVHLDFQTSYNSGVNVTGTTLPGSGVNDVLRDTAKFAAEQVIGYINPEAGLALSAADFIESELAPKPVLDKTGITGSGTAWESFEETTYEIDKVVHGELIAYDTSKYGYAFYDISTVIEWKIPIGEENTYTLQISAKNIMGFWDGYTSTSEYPSSTKDGAEASVNITIKKGSISLLNAYTENINPSAPKNTFYTKDYTLSNEVYHVSPSLIVRGVAGNGIPIHLYIDWGDGHTSSVYRYSSNQYYSFSHTYYPGIPQGSSRKYTIIAKAYTDNYYGGWSDSKSITITVINNGKSEGTAGGGGGGIGGGGIGCPYLSTWNGTGYAKDNTILIGSELTKNKTITDYMKVENSVTPENGKYSFQISEFERERTKLDSVKLMTVDHPENVDIALTTDKHIITYSDPIPPISCEDQNGNSVLSEISYPDDNGMEGNSGDFIIANFGNISSGHVKLLIKSDVKPNPGGINPVSFPETDTEKGLIVAIHNKNGTWTNISHFVPRALWYTDAFVLDPYIQNASQPLEIAVGWLDYHKLDWIAIDTTEEVPVEIHTYAPVKAYFNGEDVLDALMYADKDNITLVPKQNMTVDFPYEEPENDMIRDLIFISTGRYDTIPRAENIGFDVYQYVQMSVKICGKPGNTVNINILEDGKKIANLSITREHGNPDNNIKNISFRKYIDREYKLELVNEGRKGCNPVKITFISVFTGRNETIKERIKAGHSKTVEIHDVLEDVLKGEKAFFFEFAPPYYDIPSNWISEISWDFGDNTTAFGPIPIHFYHSSGDFYVKMTVVYTDNLSVTTTKTISVS